MDPDKISDVSKGDRTSLIEFFEMSEDLFIILDENFRIIYVNPQIEKLFNIKREDIAGKVLGMFSEFANLWVKIGVYPLKDGDFVVNVIDITEKEYNRKFAGEALKDSKKKIQELITKLHRADKHKSNLISTLSHEFRNPLATITMALSLAEHTTPGDEQDMRMRKIIKHQTAQLIRFVDDLLDVAGIERNRIELIKKNVEVNEIVKEVIEGFRAQFDEKKVALEEKYYTDFLYINADPVRIRQVMENLLSNSLKFTKQGGTVRLATFKDGDKNAVIKVSDTGIGISPELLPDIFEPFVQADNSPARSAGGLGLGLSIVKGIVDLYGGSIVVESKGLGRGSEFIIKLPTCLGKMCKGELP
ncbi:MAG: ATP-binding protein [Natronincolaceae bacterium]